MTRLCRSACVCTLLPSRHSRELPEEAIFFTIMCTQDLIRELERLTGTRLPEVKALWARRGNPSCWIYALPEPTPFKSQLDTTREKKHKSKNRAVKGNIHGCRCCCCCSAEWKII